MNEAEFLARVERQLHGHFGWEENESWAGTTSAGGMRLGEPDFSHVCSVKALPLSRPSSTGDVVLSWWEWSARCSSGGVRFRAKGYAKSKDEGKTACERAVRTLALGVLAQWKETH
jgi:hypothetical protein